MVEKLDKYYFDKMYSKTKGSYWGMKPTPLIIDFEKMLKRKSDVLDLGCGEGRVALYLAKKGHKVTAVDISSAAISKLKNYAKEAKVKINTKIVDLENYKIKKNFDIIISLATLHFLSKKGVYKMIKDIKKKTRKNGINFITVFRKGDPSEGKWEMYHFENGELLRMYSDWEIINYKEFRKKDQHGPKGKIHYHKNADIIAKKIK